MGTNVVCTAEVEVVLRSNDGQDGFNERRFILGPNTKMPIGRASKNSAKPELMMAQTNAFIDSPVISREHAVLSLDPSPPTPTVCIVDNGSMHGTTVNGTNLEPNRPLKLSDGDVLQFGQDVTRNDSRLLTPLSEDRQADRPTPGFFVARRYTFSSSIPAHYPHGFSVPSGDISEEEDMDLDEVEELMEIKAPRYGSQINPVDLDDFEDAPPAAVPEIIEIDDDEEDEEDDTIVRVEPAAASEETEECISPSSAQQHVIPVPTEEHLHPELPSPEEAVNDHEEVAPHGSTFVREASSGEDEEDSVYTPVYTPVYQSDSDSPLYGSNTGQADDESNSDAEPSSDPEASDDYDKENEEEEEDEDDEDDEDDKIGGENDDEAVLRRMKMEMMLNDERKPTTVSEAPVIPHPSAQGAVPQLSNTPPAPLSARDELHNFFNTGAQPAPHPTLRAPESAMPTMDPYMSTLSMFDDAYGSHVFGHVGSPLPPRPAAPKPGPSWGASPYSHPYTRNPFAREASNLGIFHEDVQTANMYMPSNPEFSSGLFDRFSGPVGSDAFHAKLPPHLSTSLIENPWGLAKSPTTSEVPTSTIAAADRVQTPPSAPASEVSSPPHPRRTKVSIPEIVDSPQQPPTPTSVVGSLKRKADVFEEDILDAALEPSSSAGEAQASSAVAPKAEVTNVPATAAPQRPIKRLRSRLGSAAKNMAAYILPGAALTVALITQLPEAFYEN
jgi:hypothetical protein